MSWRHGKRCTRWILPNGSIPDCASLECQKSLGKSHGIWHEAEYEGITYRWARAGGASGIFRVTA